MTTEQPVTEKPAEVVEEAKKPRVYSEEEWGKNTSKLQKQITALERERDTVRQQAATTEAELQQIREELELSGLTDEDEKKLRRELAKSRRELDQRQAIIRDAEQELGRRAKEFFAEQLAAQYGVDKDSLMEFGTVVEMRAAALEAEVTRLKAEKEKPAAKPKPEPLSAQESGEALVSRKRVQDMTDAEFGPFWEAFKARNAAAR